MIHFSFMSVPITNVAVPNSLVEHFDVMWLVVIAAIAIIVWFASKAFNKIETNQDELFKRMRVSENQLSHLKGEHESMCGGIIPILAELKSILKRYKNLEESNE